MDEDILSDVVPSNIVSRQVCIQQIGVRWGLTAKCSPILQPSQGAEGESEYDDEPMEEDELESEAEVHAAIHVGLFWRLMSTGVGGASTLDVQEDQERGQGKAEAEEEGR
jgi:hypothetical protein